MAYGSAVAVATLPPPDPVAVYTANQPVCMHGFAMLLADDERGERFSDTGLAVSSGGGFQFSVNIYGAIDVTVTLGRARRSSAMDALRSLRSVTIPGFGEASRTAVSEWPGNRTAGWVYLVPLEDNPMPDYLTITSSQFVGTEADYPVLRRVLTGDARRRICPHS